MVFDEYAYYYDLLYTDKDYIGEATYINNVLKKYIPDAETLADLGCGTGRHAELLTKYGYEVFGVDMSQDMLEEALKRAVGNSKLAFQRATLQDFQLQQKADCITALFHVISYQSTDVLLEKAFQNIYQNLKNDGVFLFDCWYGPAVLTLKPELRVKRMENQKVEVTRIAEPTLRENENIVEVNYEVYIKDKETNKIHVIKEKHVMRYFFINELRMILEKCGFTLVDSFEFMTGAHLGKNTWGSAFVVKKRWEKYV